MWASSGDDGGAGIWHAGGGLMSDGSGRIFVATGNGSAASPGPGTSPPEGLGESVIRLDTSIAAQDFFSPYDSETLDWWDADFGSGGPVGLPDTFGTPKRPHVLVAVGKNGYVYLLDRDDLGGKGQGDAGGDAASVVRLGPFGGVWSSPAVWPGDGGWVYIPTASGGTSSAGSSGSLDFYRSGRTPDGLPTLSRAGSTEDAFGLGSSPPVVSSNGTASGSALVWILWSPYPGGQGELRAYRPTADGDTPPEPVYSAPVGEATKYNPPGIAGGRVYVGTADGHVLGFGAPTDPGLTGGDVEFDAVTLGDSSRQTATFTATRDLTVTGLSASGPFQAGAASLPAIMSKGDTLDVPVTFTPARTGPAGGALTAQTSAGTFSLGLTGSGRAATALLSASPKVVPFDGVAVGRRSTQSVTVRNDGSQDLSFAGADAPGAPFALSAQPSGTLAPGDSQTLTVTFAPTAPGSFSGTLTVHSSAGDVSIGLSGSAGAPGRLSVSAPGDFGDVTVGEHADRQLVVANTGGTRLTVTKSKPPVSGAFSALDALPEGTTLAPGASRTLTIRFAPSTTGPARDAWQISADDGSTDPVAVALTGTGVIVQLQPVPPPLAPPPALPAPPVPKPLRPSALRVSTDAEHLVIRFRLARAARVDVTVLRGAHAAKTARRSARAGDNRVLLSRHGLRAGLYRVRIAPAGGAAARASLRIRR
jgi:iron transport multicopper oxidase